MSKTQTVDVHMTAVTFITVFSVTNKQENEAAVSEFTLQLSGKVLLGIV